MKKLCLLGLLFGVSIFGIEDGLFTVIRSNGRVLERWNPAFVNTNTNLEILALKFIYSKIDGGSILIDDVLDFVQADQDSFNSDHLNTIEARAISYIKDIAARPSCTAFHLKAYFQGSKDPRGIIMRSRAK